MMKSVSPYEELLRKLRGNLAHKSQMEPFKVFNDEMLRALLKKKPRTLEEIATVKGFPKDGTRFFLTSYARYKLTLSRRKFYISLV